VSFGNKTRKGGRRRPANAVMTFALSQGRGPVCPIPPVCRSRYHTRSRNPSRALRALRHVLVPAITPTSSEWSLL
jgi:hypothetical protein